MIKKHKWRVFACTGLLLLAAAVCFWLNAGYETVDYCWYGELVDGNGNTIQNVEFAACGKLAKSAFYEFEVKEFDIQWPEGFLYQSTSGDKLITSCAIGENRWYLISGYAHNMQNGKPQYQKLCLLQEEGVALVCWNGVEDQYVIASTDPSADIQTLWSDYAKDVLTYIGVVDR